MYNKGAMMRRTKEEAEQTRQSLLKAALSIFSQKGYASTTLEDVAQEAGVTRGAIYWHFGGKAELYSALLDKYSARANDIVQAEVAAGGDLVDILRRIFIRLLTAVEEDPSLRAVMEINLLKTEYSPELSDTLTRQIENGRALLAGIAQAMVGGIAAGELRSDLDPTDMARAFIAFQNGVLHLWMMDPTAFELGERAPHLAEILMGGIARAAEPV
jgi:TetR/AcrR family acrAB operon transcriptional repressor